MDIIIPSKYISQPTYNVNQFYGAKISLYNLFWKTVLIEQLITPEYKNKITELYDNIVDQINQIQNIYQQCTSVEDLEKNFNRIGDTYAKLLSDLNTLTNTIKPILNDKNRISFCKNSISRDHPWTLDEAVKGYIKPDLLHLLYDFRSKHWDILNQHGQINIVEIMEIKYGPENKCPWCRNDIRSRSWHTCYKSIPYTDLDKYWDDLIKILNNFKINKSTLIQKIKQELEIKLKPYINSQTL